MGIKTLNTYGIFGLGRPLKNLPTTWGLRPDSQLFGGEFNHLSENPPHHMWIKTHC